MLRSYLKVAWRNLTKNKTFSAINIIGLAIGLSCFLLIALYVMDELSYDRFNEKASRIYRINSDIKFGGADLHMPLSADQMGELLKKDYPQVEDYTRLYTFSGDKLVKKGSSYIIEKNVGNADSTFFNVFTLPAVEGNTKTALNEPNTVVISASAAYKYFGSASNVVGKSLEVEQDGKPFPYKITAVIKDIPENSHLKLDMIFSMKNVDYNWGHITSHNFYTYLLLKENANVKDIESKFPEYTLRYVLPQIKQYMNISSMDELRKAGNNLEYSLMPLTKIHLYSDRAFEMRPSGNIQYVYIFSAVALFILLIACINFMNLTTARSANRAKEVGIRKVLGTERKELILQFLFESTLMVVISLAIALVIVYGLLPVFNNVADKKMVLQSLLSPYILPLLILLPFVTGLLAGSYPAFYLSAFRPIEVLKGKLRMGGKGGGLRSVLVVFQFTTSIILIIGTIVVYKQLHFIQNTNLGFNKEQVLVLDGTGVLGNNVAAFKNDILQLQGVESGTISPYLPVANSSRSDNSFSKTPVMSATTGFDMQQWTVDYDYIKTMGMQLLKGRNFSRDFGSDSTAIIINETTANVLGYADPIGQKIYSTPPEPGVAPKSYTIIGVVKNFNYETVHRNVGPLGLELGQTPWSMSFRVNTGNINNLIAQIKNKWTAMVPGMPFSYRFMNESFDAMYHSEQRVGTIAIIFSVLAIFIACLGLFGLATFIAEQRTKEIGIRKVLGASVKGIVQMLSKDFIRLVLIAFVFAAPLAGWAMHRWLQDFAFRIQLQWWMFAVAGAGALIIALLTVTMQAIRAALMNPVKSLRTE